jgi:hypothetical protein
LGRARRVRSEIFQQPEYAFMVSASYVSAATAKYRVPGEATNMFLLLIALFCSLADVESRDRRAYSVAMTAFVDLYHSANARAAEDNIARDYSLYGDNGRLRPWSTAADVVAGL